MIHICIIGLGLMGGSLGMALRRVRWKGRRVFSIHGTSHSASSLRLAKKRGAADKVTASLVEAVSESDIIVLATPVQFMPGIVKKILPSIKKGALLTDVGSVKSRVGDEIRKVLKKRKDLEFVGAHPLAGSEKSGIQNAKANMFEDSVCLISSDHTEKSAIRRVSHMWRAVGAKPIFLSSSKHDEILALTSHLPHVLAFALFSQVHSAASHNGQFQKFISGSFRDMTRIAGSDAGIWEGILSSNRQELSRSWTAFQVRVNQMLKSPAHKLHRTLAKISAEKHRWKQK